MAGFTGRVSVRRRSDVHIQCRDVLPEKVLSRICSLKPVKLVTLHLSNSQFIWATLCELFIFCGQAELARSEILGSSLFVVKTSMAGFPQGLYLQMRINNQETVLIYLRGWWAGKIATVKKTRCLQAPLDKRRDALRLRIRKTSRDDNEEEDKQEKDEKEWGEHEWQNNDNQAHGCQRSDRKATSIARRSDVPTVWRWVDCTWLEEVLSQG